MKRAVKQDIPAAERVSPGSAGSLPYGLRELAPLPSLGIFCGMLTAEGERFVLEVAEHRYPLDVRSPLAVDRRLLEQKVSVLGQLNERTPSAEGGGGSIVATKMVSHEAIARRAYQMHESCRDNSAVDNWLCAQRELLER